MIDFREKKKNQNKKSERMKIGSLLLLLSAFVALSLSLTIHPRVKFLNSYILFLNI